MPHCSGSIAVDVVPRASRRAHVSTNRALTRLSRSLSQRCKDLPNRCSAPAKVMHGYRIIGAVTTLNALVDLHVIVLEARWPRDTRLLFKNQCQVISSSTPNICAVPAISTEIPSPLSIQFLSGYAISASCSTFCSALMLTGRDATRVPFVNGE